jgi:hypothetical protein
VKVTTSEDWSAPSSAVARSTYVPAAGKMTVVAAAFGAAMFAAAGPLVCDHVTTRVSPKGSPSSAMTATSGTLSPWSTVASAPASTLGA